MENNLKYIVYCTKCTANNKIYIGVHRTNPIYFDGYLGNGCYISEPSYFKHSKTKFLAALNKYGVNKFQRSTIAIFDNEDDAYNLEAQIVNEEFLKRPDVYNMALGGKFGCYNINAIPIFQYDAAGNFINLYNSINEAAKAVNRNLRSLLRALEDKIKCANYFWTFKKFNVLDLSKMHLYEGVKKIPVFLYNSNGNYECCYDSIMDASKVLNIHSANISDAIKLGSICNNKNFTNIFSYNYSIAKNKQIKSYEVHLYSLDGNYINSYKSMADAKKAVGVKSDIYKAIRLGRLAGGYLWSFEKLEKIAPIKNKSGRPRKIGKYTKDWQLIKIYDTLQSCKQENGSGMIHVLQGRDLFAKGFRYKYED